MPQAVFPLTMVNKACLKKWGLKMPNTTIDKTTPATILTSKGTTKKLSYPPYHLFINPISSLDAPDLKVSR